MNFKICVSGASDGDCLTDKNLHLAHQVGATIAKQKCVLLTGATTGIPYAAAVGAKKQKGVSIGFSPAFSVVDHINRYRAPTKNMDVIVYTGFGYAGRDLLLTRSADAVIIICGRIGTLNEFSIAFEDKKPIGILEGSDGITTDIEGLVEKARKRHDLIIYESDPEKLVKQMVEALKVKYETIEKML